MVNNEINSLINWRNWQSSNQGCKIRTLGVAGWQFMQRKISNSSMRQVLFYTTKIGCWLSVLRKSLLAHAG